MKKLTIVIVSYNVKEYLAQCLDSLRIALEGVDAEVVVVDNCSSDGSVEYISDRYPEVRVIANNKNVGFAQGNNIAIRDTQSEYVLLLNPDTKVGDDTIRRALAFMDAHPRAGAAGVLMRDADGNRAPESRRGIPTPMTAFYKFVGLTKRFPKSHRFGQYYMSYLPWDSPQRIEIVSGAFCLLRREALNIVGLLDEDFFMYGEDIDLSYRILKGGYENWYLPYPIIHYKGRSTEKSSYRYVHVFYKAMFIFLKKHYPTSSIFLTIPIKLAILVIAAMSLCRMQLKATLNNTKFRKILHFHCF